VTVDGGCGAAVQCGQWGCEPAGGGWSRGNESNGELIDGGWGAHEYDGGVYRVWEIFRSAPRW
jgi:hypothetical protein